MVSSARDMGRSTSYGVPRWLLKGKWGRPAWQHRVSSADGTTDPQTDFPRGELQPGRRSQIRRRQPRERGSTRYSILMHTSGFWFAVGLLAVCETAIVVTALRMRVRTSGPLSIVGRRPAEIGWTLLPALLLVALVALSLQPL